MFLAITFVVQFKTGYSSYPQARAEAASVAARLLGGQAHVSLEDKLYFRHGDLTTNVPFMERIVRIVREPNMEPATPAKARAMIGLPCSNALRPE